MPHPLERARASLAAWMAARARAELAIAHGAGEDDPDRRAAAVARRALGSGEVRDAIESAARATYITPAEHGAILDALARAARDEVYARREVAASIRLDATAVVDGMPRGIGALAHEAIGDGDPRRREAALVVLAREVDADRVRRLESRAEADAIVAQVRARGPRALDDGPDDLVTQASRFLDATDDAAREAIERAAHARGMKAPRTIADAAFALRAPALDPIAKKRDRARRIAGTLAPLGLEAPLASRVSVERDHAMLDVDARVIALDPPRRVAIALSGLELGVTSELAVARAIGRALSGALVAPALPIELRDGAAGSVGHGLGELLASLHADAVFLRRAHGLDGAPLDAQRRGAAACLLLRARSLAARAIADARQGSDRRELGAALLARAVGAAEPTMPAWLADPASIDPDLDRRSLRAALLAPAIVRALRERHDEDWFRNPRAADDLRAACGQGLGLAIETWATELGPSPRPSEGPVDG